MKKSIEFQLVKSISEEVNSVKSEECEKLIKEEEAEVDPKFFATQPLPEMKKENVECIEDNVPFYFRNISINKWNTKKYSQGTISLSI